MVEIRAPYDLPCHTRNPRAVDTLYHLISGQHQATRSRVELAQHLTDKTRIAALSENVEGLLVKGTPCVRATSIRHQCMNKVVLILLKSFVARCMYRDS